MKSITALLPRYLAFLASSLLLLSSSALADKPHGPKAIEVKVAVGTADGQMKFVPNSLTFERGNYYKLVITNPSAHEHYFTSDAFATHIFTRKIEVLDKSKKTIAEIHGAVHDLELLCRKNDHEAQGMVGTINIVGDL